MSRSGRATRVSYLEDGEFDDAELMMPTEDSSEANWNSYSMELIVEKVPQVCFGEGGEEV